MNAMLTLLRRGLLVLLAALPLIASAAPNAQQVVQQTVDNLLSDLKANKPAYRADPKQLYAALDRILGPVVDSEGIARGVMTVKYSRQASPEQIKRFETVFKNSLMQFYGNALLEYDNQDIRVLPSTGKQDPERSSVNMEIRDSKGTVYPVQYTMVNQSGTWRLRNVIINGINIGKLFRDQFADSMQKNGNDLEKTIAGWDQVVAHAKDAAKGNPDEGGAQ
jgi:phospholipid transport system substrate-binding protein